jgi:hypothetical protein
VEEMPVEQGLFETGFLARNNMIILAPPGLKGPVKDHHEKVLIAEKEDAWSILWCSIPHGGTNRI